MPGDAFQILSSQTRRRIIELLTGNRSGLSVGEVAASLHAKEPSVSQHLKVLREGGLVTSRREGRRIVYRLAPGSVATRLLNARSPRRPRLSARNRLLGTVTAIQRDRVTSAVTLDVSGHTVQAVITTAALEDLDLEIGDSAYAVVKATEVMLMK